VSFPDTPGGLGSPDAGIVATDAGLSLPATGAPLLPSNCTGGTYRGCAHSLCETGAKLTSGCDVAAYPAGCTLKTNGGRSYLFCSQTATWAAAASACTAQGMSLVTINSAAESTWVGAQAKSIVSGTWWTGLNDLKGEGSFLWQDGTSIPYLNWASGQPSATSAGDDCVTLNAATSPYTWDDVSCTTARPYVCEAVPPAAACVASVCAARPSCCATQWDSSCVAQAKTSCSVSCGVAEGSQCVLCFQDNIDHDGDGYSYQEGDCLDCDPQTNPGALDFPGNGLDEDCSGVADDEPKDCDVGLALNTNDPKNHARAIDLCRFSTDPASGAAKTWGVVESRIVQANTTSAPNYRQYGVLPKFGTSTANDPTYNVPINAPRKGQRLAAYSSGTARDATQVDYVNPSGQVSSYSVGSYVSPPAGFPKAASGCPGGNAAYDSSGLWMRIRVPTNAQSFKYNFNFFSSEYPEWVCTSYNDSFIALLSSGHPINVANAGAPNNKNISFDNVKNPVSVNAGFFGVPGGAYLTSPKLSGTGFDGNCGGGQICGGATDWLKTTAPVLAGEIITVHFSVWDTGDTVWDSSVLLDAWEWSANPSGISTAPEQPPPLPQYNEASFNRDYDASTICPSGTAPVWGLWSWSAVTPSDTKIEFYIRASATAAGLAGATEYPLRFSNPPGPAGLVGQNAVARTSPTNTTVGAAVASTTLAANGLVGNLPFVRVRSRLVPSTDKLAAPTLASWNLELSCPPTE
jgi:hypothetical protein